jgi:hypothetical protein
LLQAPPGWAEKQAVSARLTFASFCTFPMDATTLYHSHVSIWQCVKTLYPCSSHQNSWDLWMFIPLKMVFS